ncbi:hypothetical protein RFI_19818 [Reticulomyxa filosa]|uniref:Uncharacterized protein n=1 Tax=Reticulomyxa filosa TaxID=46433 RepID=X6MUL2_RETFI|nr:hypothetical protein RFI_19818 [Reticulomyxa filosa]|eukprot:ETO17504.1 hypothetical protein RFI_19818 [Reticulomyxa filosa]
MDESQQCINQIKSQLCFRSMSLSLYLQIVIIKANKKKKKKMNIQKKTFNFIQKFQIFLEKGGGEEGTNKKKNYFEFKSPQQQQMEMMMGGGVRFPSALGNLDCRFPKLACRVRFDMISNGYVLLYEKKKKKESKIFLLHIRIQHEKCVFRWALGAKIGTSYDVRKSWLEFGTRYEFGALKAQSRPYQHCIEALWRKDSWLLQLFYTNNVTDNFALTSRLSWQIGTTDKIQSSIGYKFQFGKALGAGKTIIGEIASDGRVCQSITLPLLPTMMLRCYGELNHWTTPELMQRGLVPHKFEKKKQDSMIRKSLGVFRCCCKVRIRAKKTKSKDRKHIKGTHSNKFVVCYACFFPYNW